MVENGTICYESNDALYVPLICVIFLSAKSVKAYENGKLFTVCSIALWVDFYFRSGIQQYLIQNEKVLGQRRSIP